MIRFSERCEDSCPGANFIIGRARAPTVTFGRVILGVVLTDGADVSNYPAPAPFLALLEVLPLASRDYLEMATKENQTAGTHSLLQLRPILVVHLKGCSRHTSDPVPNAALSMASSPF